MANNRRPPSDRKTTQNCKVEHKRKRGTEDVASNKTKENPRKKRWLKTQ